MPTPTKYHIEVVGRLLYHYNVLSANGQVILTSETYYSKANAERAASRFSRAFGDLVVRYQMKGGK